MNEQSHSIASLAAAVVAAQSELRNPVKDSVNPFFKSRYADLATVRDAVVPVLASHGLAVVQMPTTLSGQPALTSTLVHKSGEWMSSTMLLCAAKTDPQGIGSAITYARRYALQAIAGVTAEDDDDGNAGSQPQRQQGGRAASNGNGNGYGNGNGNGNGHAQRPTDAEMKEIMLAKGWGWTAVINEINRNHDENYHPSVKPDGVPSNYLRSFFDWLKVQPKATKASA